MSELRFSEPKHFLNMHKKLEFAIKDYNMIEENDHVLAAMSGGKDSTVMLKLLARKKVMTTNNFKLSALFVRQGFDNDDKKIEFLGNYCENLKVPFFVTDALVSEAFETRKEGPCYICSRMRRLAIFNFADTLGIRVISFGHHKDDFIETFFMNILQNGDVSTIKPNNLFFEGKYRVIRPMLYIDEQKIINEAKDLPKFSSGCPYECNSERSVVKKLLKELYAKNRQTRSNIFRSMFSVKEEYMLKEPSCLSILR